MEEITGWKVVEVRGNEEKETMGRREISRLKEGSGSS